MKKTAIVKDKRHYVKFFFSKEEVSRTIVFDVELICDICGKSETFMIESGYKENPEEAVKECLELLEAAKLFEYKCSDQILTASQIANKVKEKCEYIAQNYYTCSCRHQEECSCEWYYCNEIAKEINKRV